MADKATITKTVSRSKTVRPETITTIEVSLACLKLMIRNVLHAKRLGIPSNPKVPRLSAVSVVSGSSLNCADMKKSDLQVVERIDIFWACKTCTLQAPNPLAKAKNNQSGSDKGSAESIQDTIVKSLNEIENRLEAKLDAKLRATVKEITATINPIHQQVTETVEKSVSQNVTKMWSDTLFGDTVQHDETFPDVNDPRSKDAPIKPKMTLKKVIKEVATEQKKEDLDRENRLKNVIIHRAPETHNPSAKARADQDANLVNNLLKSIEVETKPAKIFRLGKYKEPNQGESFSRPLKVIFESQSVQQEVLNNANKLQNADDQLKQLSIGYDMTETERNTIKSLVEEAKEK